MRYECDECFVKFSLISDYDENHSQHHYLKTKIAELYKIYKKNQTKCRTGQSIGDRSFEWNVKLLKLISDKDIHLDFDVFVNVLFKPYTYYKHQNRDEEFVS